MTDGTQCDLINNKPRVTKVLYVCYAHGKNEVYSLKEVSTCQYEVIILAPSLCAHPNFKPQEMAENTIRCSPQMFAPVQPKAAWIQSNKNHLVKLDLEVIIRHVEIRDFFFFLFYALLFYCFHFSVLFTFCRI